jgi:sugar phosphate isomerase/epimerase
MIDPEHIVAYAKELGISAEEAEVFLSAFFNSSFSDIEVAFFKSLIQDKKEILRLRNIVAENGYEYTPHQFVQNIKLLIYIKTQITKEN